MSKQLPEMADDLKREADAIKCDAERWRKLESAWHIFESGGLEYDLQDILWIIESLVDEKLD